MTTQDEPQDLDNLKELLEKIVSDLNETMPVLRNISTLQRSQVPVMALKLGGMLDKFSGCENSINKILVTGLLFSSLCEASAQRINELKNKH